MLNFEKQLAIATTVAACVLSVHLLRVLFFGVYNLRAAPQLFFITLAAVSLGYLATRRNWARRTWLVLGFVWGLAGLLRQLQSPSVPLAVAGAASIGIFVWLMRRRVRRHFTTTRRTWGFAGIVAGMTLLLSSVVRTISPSSVEGPLPTFRIEGEAQLAGAAVGRGLMILFSLWLTWSGFRRERSSTREMP